MQHLMDALSSWTPSVSPLFEAVESNSLEQVKSLIEQGENVNAKDDVNLYNF
jgi:hypothetical protein